MMTGILACIVLLALATNAVAFQGIMHFTPRMTDFPAPEELLETNEPFFVEMPLDHFSNASVNGTSTFQNRYWINATYYEPGGPVFLFDSGEQNAAPLLPYYLQEYHGLSATIRLAKRYKGIAILWEHRYYGGSMPFPVNSNTTPEEWQFLTTEQALEDVVFFTNSFNNDTSSTGDISDPLSLPLHPSTVPWIWLGGSYPGIRGAHLRIRNPEVIFAAWASSAPVQAEMDMSSYYKAAERSLTRNCSADWVAITKHVDTVLKGSNQTLINDVKFRLLKARLSGPGGNTTGAQGLTMEQASRTSDVDAASVLMDPLDFYQYYGFAASLLPFCNLVETKNFTSSPLEGGIVSSAEGQAGAIQAFNAFLVGIAELDYDSIRPFKDDPATNRAWMRQYCSEYGFYQRGDVNNPLSIETSFRSLDLFQQQCNDTFVDHLPTWPQVENVNKYGGWDMNVSNVLFTNGEFDPWRTMGLASIEPDSPHREPSVSIPACNVALPYPSFFGLTHSNMVHVSDLRVLLIPDPNHTNFQTVGFYSPIAQEPFYAGLGLFQLALDEWLPCFGST